MLVNAGFCTPEEFLNACKVSLPDLAKAAVEIRGGKETEERQRIRDALGELIKSGSYILLQRIKSVSDQQLLNM